MNQTRCNKSIIFGIVSGWSMCGNIWTYFVVVSFAQLQFKERALDAAVTPTCLPAVINVSSSRDISRLSHKKKKKKKL